MKSKSKAGSGVDQEVATASPPLINDKHRRRASKPLAHCYLVCSPEYGEVVPILDDGSGPMEYGRDVVWVFTRNVRRAKVLALRWFRRQYAGKWRHNWITDGGNPFTGITVELAYGATPLVKSKNHGRAYNQ